MAGFRVKLLLAATLLAGLTVFQTTVTTSTAGAADSLERTRLLDYLRQQNTTGFLVIQDGKTLIEKNWPAPEGNPQFALFAYERDAEGALLEDVASQQKSFIAVLMAIAVDKGLIDVQKPVSDYIGAGWSKATPLQEAAIRVIDLLTMSSGLDDKFGYVAPAGTQFYYNTPVYAVTKRVLAVASKQSLDAVTRDWLTGPAGMKATTWRKRPAVLAGIGNDTGLVTSPRDTARFGSIILSGGLVEDGKRIISEASIKAMLTPSATNPAYGHLWWLNSSQYTLRAVGERREGPLVTAAPADMVAALGAFDRRLYIVPSARLIVVRTGAAAGDKAFDEQLWQLLMKVIS